jgi:hypothetical protein
MLQSIAPIFNAITTQFWIIQTSEHFITGDNISILYFLSTFSTRNRSIVNAVVLCTHPVSFVMQERLKMSHSRKRHLHIPVHFQ